MQQMSLSIYSYPSRKIILVSSIACMVSKQNNLCLKVGYLAVVQGSSIEIS